MGLPENFIPEGQLPQCWSDDVRMNALFAPFRLKAANPESWEMKMKFWSDMLRLWCKCRQDPIVSASDAKFAFQRKGRTPACIDIVIEEMFRNGDLAPISKYHQILHNGPEGWVRWGARLAFKPAAFALSAVTSLLPARQATDNDGLPKASIDSTQRFVLECAVKDQATDFLNNYPPGLERIGTVDELMRNSGWLGTREVFELVLGYLVSQGSAVKKDEVVKIAEPNKKATPVTDTDEALVKLMAAETRLETDAERLALDAAAADTEARAALQLGNRIAAKNHLCRKHKFLIRSDRCTAVLDNVRQLLHQMRDVSVNAAVLDTYRTSSEAMKREMKQSGLEEDAVHDTLDDLKEVMDSYSEIEKALGATSDEDMEDLEAELKELLSTPGAGGGTPGKTRAPEAKVPVLPSPPGGRPARRDLDREGDFVFDGEERVLAELTELADEATPKGKAKPQKSDLPKPQPKSLPMKPWYPPSAQCLSPAEPWNNNYGFPELRQDERLHPGQPLKVDFTTPPRHYCDDFQVKDHKMASGVWLYNTKDSNSNVGSDLATSTEYFSSESAGKSDLIFQMAPGGERKKSNVWNNEEDVVDDLEIRLRNLRGFNL